jgi:hypothetical protein
MALDKHQLARLHGVLGPFMLRRVKKDVVAEMVPKTEVRLDYAAATFFVVQTCLQLCVLCVMLRAVKMWWLRWCPKHR